MEIKDIIRVETLPKIVQQLEQLSIEVDGIVNEALALECNEESKQDVKKARANINKIKTELEDRRKWVKEQILEPYYQFEDVYNNLVKGKLLYADDILKSRVEQIELTQKQEKENNVKDYFEEYNQSLHLENIVNWDQLNIKIGLSDSEKKLREEVKSKLDKINSDIELIKLEEYKDEIMVEYLKDFDFAKAKLTVFNRINEINRLKEESAKKEQQEQLDKSLEKQVDEITIPVEIVENSVEKVFTTRFQVSGTREQLIALKEYMIQNKIEFTAI